MGFFQTIRSAFFDPAFYAGMANRSWADAAKYYLVIAFVIIFVYASPVWGLLLTANPELVDTVVALYPDDLTITVADGSMSINKPEPFAIPNTWTEELPENLIVFDTQNDEYTPTALDEAKTLVLLKDSFAIVQDSDANGQQRILDYGTSTGTSTLVRSDITAVAEKIKPYVRPVAIVGGAFLFVLAILLGGIFMLAYHLVYTLLAALLVLGYFKFRKSDATYTTAYTTTLFASLPVAIIAAAAGLFGGLPTFTYTLIVLIIVVVNCSRAPAEAPRA